MLEKARHLSGLPTSFTVLLLLATFVLWSAPGHTSELRRTAIVRAVEATIPSVVNIHGQKTNDSAETSARVNGMGTGIVIDERGYILTNYHVVEGVERIQVSTRSGKTVLARLVGQDHATDLAIIRIDVATGLPVIRMGTSNDLMLGEPVIAIGNAYGYPHTITRGIISQLHRPVQVSEDQKYLDLIQTDASINPGNSGGPLLNIDGDVIGINVAVRVGAQGIGFAVPIDQAIEVASRLLNAHISKQIHHGVVGKTVATEHKTKFVITSVSGNSPASRSGLQPGDVISSIDEQPVYRPLDFERKLLDHSAGEELALEIHRNDQPVSVNLMLASSTRQQRPISLSQRIWSQLGLRLVPAGQQTFSRGNSRYRGGLKVVDVLVDGVSAQQGIRYGDVLVGIQKWETVSLDNVAYILDSDHVKRGSPLKFYVIRNGETLFGHLQID
ncbi:MAG: trypsin-like peptidase domain-containing protein [Pirellulaceae bacterium]|jgi:serine protease Do|nr:trypsin-like peptidase domain-containing protein [Pirellulaceae bacterium]